MADFDISKLKRNAEAIRKQFVVKDDTTYLSNERLQIMFPERYIKKELAILNTDYVRLVGIYAILDYHGNYAVVNTPIYQNLLPLSTENITVDEKPYVLLTLEENSMIMESNTLTVMNNFVYDIFYEFFLKGNIPWFLSYEDVARLFEQGSKYANIGTGNDPIIFEILTATITRNSNNKTVYYRQDSKGSPSFVGLNDIRYGFDNTGARLIGGYFKDGITTALVDKEKTTSETSRILRS